MQISGKQFMISFALFNIAAPRNVIPPFKTNLNSSDNILSIVNGNSYTTGSIKQFNPSIL